MLQKAAFLFWADGNKIGGNSYEKIINSVEQVENEMVLGMAKAYPQYVRKLDCGNVVVRANRKEGKVALISGGGSGHEPAHGGYVGEGMLDAAVSGAVFTSPTPDQIYEGIKQLPQTRAFSWLSRTIRET